MRKYSRISETEHRALLPDELFQRFHRKTARCCCCPRNQNAGDSSRGWYDIALIYKQDIDWEVG